MNRKERRQAARARIGGRGSHGQFAHTRSRHSVRRILSPKRPNPTVSPIAQAARTFKKWHGFDPRNVQRVATRSRTIPATLVKLGTLPEIVYRSTKWGGKPVTYTHSFKAPHPMLCTDAAGRELFFLRGGSRTRVTKRGLVG